MRVTPEDIVTTAAGTAVATGASGPPPGPHKALIEPADPTHKLITGQAVSVTVPAPKSRGRAI